MHIFYSRVFWTLYSQSSEKCNLHEGFDINCETLSTVFHLKESHENLSETFSAIQLIQLHNCIGKANHWQPSCTNNSDRLSWGHQHTCHQQVTLCRLLASSRPGDVAHVSKEWRHRCLGRCETGPRSPGSTGVCHLDVPAADLTHWTLLMHSSSQELAYFSPTNSPRLKKFSFINFTRFLVPTQHLFCVYSHFLVSVTLSHQWLLLLLSFSHHTFHKSFYPSTQLPTCSWIQYNTVKSHQHFYSI